MARVKRGQTVRARHKGLKAQTKGFRTLRRTNIKRASEAMMKAGQYAYRDRRNKKREFRALWIGRINAAVTGLGGKYSLFIKNLTTKGIILDRKVLAQIAVQHPTVFEEINKQVNA